MILPYLELLMMYATRVKRLKCLMDYGIQSLWQIFKLKCLSFVTGFLCDKIIHDHEIRKILVRVCIA